MNQVGDLAPDALPEVELIPSTSKPAPRDAQRAAAGADRLLRALLGSLQHSPEDLKEDFLERARNAVIELAQA